MIIRNKQKLKKADKVLATINKDQEKKGIQDGAG